ncbi:amino acid ABC transporter permease [Sulfurospirillum sp. 1612]|uniref:amino acid ABC transporter permease n=1 Tax=Sulfurospirillum sp. 1612 TaxID=3094835 RepID=UPI002F95EA27
MAVYNKISQREAPSNSKGAIHWMRDNLFSSPLNTALTMLGIAILVWIIPPFIKWSLIDAHFAGDSRAQCTGDGACWVFIKVKMSMFMYGFYPEVDRWRVNLVAIFFVVLIGLFKLIKKDTVRFFMLTGYFIVAFILIRGGFFGLNVVDTNKWGGLMLTIIVAAVGIVCSFPIGILFAFGRSSKLPIIKSISVTYIEFIRGVPLITILFMSSVILPLFFPEGITFNKLLRALIGITLFQAAYIAEIVRGGLQSIPSGQYEAADAIGLSYWQKMILVILPQALKVAIPNLVGSFIALFQDTTLVLIIGLFDLLAMVQLTSSDSKWLGFETEGYVFVTILFWVFCYSMSVYSRSLEKRFNTNNK